MHPEIVQDYYGSYPICGMTLEPRTVDIKEDTSELDDMTRRFWFAGGLLISGVLLSVKYARIQPEIA